MHRLPKIRAYKASDEFTACHIKRDGHCTFIEVTDNGPVITTRTPTDITAKLQWHSCYKLALQCEVGAVLAGELWLPESPASAIKTAINGQDVNLQFSVFAVLSLPADTSLAQTRAAVVKYGFDFAPYFDHAVYGFGRMPIDVEGYVFKRSNLEGWSKWKPIKTIDLICTGTTPGTGENLGKVGSIVGSTICGVEIADVGGMDQITRHNISFVESPIGKVMEVAYQCVGSKGRLRHPRLLRFRTDKPKSECTLDQDESLNRFWRTHHGN